MDEHTLYGRTSLLSAFLFVISIYYPASPTLSLILYGVTYLSIIMFALTGVMTTKEIFQIIKDKLKNI